MEKFKEQALNLLRGVMTAKDSNPMAFFYCIEFIFKKYEATGLYITQMILTFDPELNFDVITTDTKPEDWGIEGLRDYLILIRKIAWETRQLIYEIHLRYNKNPLFGFGNVPGQKEFPYDLKAVKKEENDYPVEEEEDETTFKV